MAPSWAFGLLSKCIGLLRNGGSARCRLSIKVNGWPLTGPLLYRYGRCTCRGVARGSLLRAPVGEGGSHACLCDRYVVDSRLRRPVLTGRQRSLPLVVDKRVALSARRCADADALASIGARLVRPTAYRARRPFHRSKDQYAHASPGPLAHRAPCLASGIPRL